MAKLLLSNIAMGLDHQHGVRHLLRSSMGLFLARDPDFFEMHAEVQSYCSYIKNHGADVVFLTEVCGENQKNDICDFLLSQGYNVTFVKAFELYSIPDQYIYNIIAAKADMKEYTHFQGTRNSEGVRRIVSYLRLYNQLCKPNKCINFPQNMVANILDGAGTHCKIDGIHFGLIHAHGGTSQEIIRQLLDKIPIDQKSIIGGDLNLRIQTGESLMNNRFFYVNPRNRTFPYYLQNDVRLSQAIHGFANKLPAILSHPDQIYVTSHIQNPVARALGPKQTGLRSDHAVMHIEIKD